jgi:hypothetical protein
MSWVFRIETNPSIDHSKYIMEEEINVFCIKISNLKSITYIDRKNNPVA